MSDKSGPFDWIDAAFRLAIGFFLGMAIAHGISLFTQMNFWVALAICGGAALVYFGILALDRLSNGIFNWIFPNWALPPPRGASSGKSTLFLSRFGVVIGIIPGILAVELLPQAWLDAIL